ncbi:MAG: 2-oxo-4-hydroxy-4-carboxy-5-ureidoimidazoline decarboxylase [Betaproteobacteria bacterium]|nr:2-oxo-4-hydroxy-4-carboxy-5-ureidoimidazoline decarboxylase [Betaproteobacteria bacterium]
MTSPTPLDLAALNHLDRAHFVALLGAIFEHSPWVAERAWAARPFHSLTELHTAMAAAVRAASTAEQLALICAHPELAGKEAAAGTLTQDSQTEQASAGLNHCSAAELVQLRQLNQRYREKFGFPFVMAVKHRSRYEILAALAARLEHDREREFSACLAEIEKIGRLRLEALLEAA